MAPAFVALAAPTLRRPRRGPAISPSTTPRRMPTAPSMLAKRGRRRASRRNTGGNENGDVTSGGDNGVSATPGARDEDEAYLTSLFTEDVKKPLQTSGSRKQRKNGKRGAGGTQQAGRQAPSGAEVVEAFRKQVPRDRNAWLNLLVRGAWLGIGGLVALFFVTHLVLVRDWFPSTPPSPPPVPPAVPPS